MSELTLQTMAEPRLDARSTGLVPGYSTGPAIASEFDRHS